MSYREPVVEQLMQVYHFDSVRADRAYDDLAIDPALLGAFLAWRDDHDHPLPTNESEGYSVATLVYRYGFQPVGAFLTFAWLLRDPENAKAALDRGYDEVVW